MCIIKIEMFCFFFWKCRLLAVLVTATAGNVPNKLVAITHQLFKYHFSTGPQAGHSWYLTLIGYVIMHYCMDHDIASMPLQASIEDV
jgi:hypothetical protein